MARIVHVCPRYFPARGGAEVFFQKLSEALSDRGHQVSVWTTDCRTVDSFTRRSQARLQSGPEDVRGVTVRRFPVRYLPAQRYLRTAAHLLPFGLRWRCETLRWTPWVPSLSRAASQTRAGVDLVHATGLPYSSILFAGVRLAATSGAALVISPFTHVPPPGQTGRLMRRAYLSPLNLHLLSRADRVFVQTMNERRVLEAEGLPSMRQTIVGLGVDPADCTGGDRTRFRQQRGLADDAVVVGHLANKSWDKGTVDLLDAAERLWDRNVAFSLVLAGNDMPSFTRRWTHARFPRNVVNLGELSDDERRDFFAAIDVFALPSYVESFGLSPLEAALAGSAVVAYDHGGPAEIFRHDESALLPAVGSIDALASALERLVRHSDERRRLACAGARVAQTYSWQRALDVAIAEYDTLLP